MQHEESAAKPSAIEMRGADLIQREPPMSTKGHQAGERLRSALDQIRRGAAENKEVGAGGLRSASARRTSNRPGSLCISSMTTRPDSGPSVSSGCRRRSRSAGRSGRRRSPRGMRRRRGRASSCRIAGGQKNAVTGGFSRLPPPRFGGRCGRLTWLNIERMTFRKSSNDLDLRSPVTGRLPGHAPALDLADGTRRGACRPEFGGSAWPDDHAEDCSSFPRAQRPVFGPLRRAEMGRSILRVGRSVLVHARHEV